MRRLSQLHALMGVALLMEAGGPPRVKHTQAAAELDEMERRNAERREINRALAEKQQAEAARLSSIPPHVQARIERDEKRRADRKAAKKALKKAK